MLKKKEKNQSIIHPPLSFENPYFNNLWENVQLFKSNKTVECLNIKMLWNVSYADSNLLSCNSRKQAYSKNFNLFYIDGTCLTRNSRLVEH